MPRVELVPMKECSKIKLLLSQGEGEQVEFKSARGGLPQDLWKSYSAFANTQGGTILLGVSESKKQGGKPALDYLTPQQLEQYRRDLWNLLNNKEKVSLNLLEEQDIEICEELGVIAISVRKALADERPVYLGSKPLGGTYKRNHEGDYQCSEQEVRLMMSSAQAPRLQYERSILPHSSIERDLSANTIAQYRQIFLTRKPTDLRLSLSDLDFLKHIGAYAEDRSTGLWGVTIAGLLMFGRWESLQEFLPGYFVDFQENLSGNELERWTNRICSDGSWDANLFQFFNRVLPELYRRVPVPFELRNGIRNEESGAHIALREAFVNALVHADYAQGGNILITSDQKEIVFRNPGDLLISLEQYYLGGESQCRNPRLAQMFLLIGYAERGGSGAISILKGWQGANYPRPELKEEHRPLRVSLRLTLEQLIPQEAREELVRIFGSLRLDRLNSKQMMVLYLTLSKGIIRNVDLQAELSLHPSDATFLLNFLRNRGFLLHKGNTRWRLYVLNRGDFPSRSMCQEQEVRSQLKKLKGQETAEGLPLEGIRNAADNQMVESNLSSQIQEVRSQLKKPRDQETPEDLFLEGIRNAADNQMVESNLSSQIQEVRSQLKKPRDQETPEGLLLEGIRNAADHQATDWMPTSQEQKKRPRQVACPSLEEEMERILDLCITPRSLVEICAALGRKSRSKTAQTLIQPLLSLGKLSLLYPEHPRHRGQKYYTTDNKPQDLSD